MQVKTSDAFLRLLSEIHPYKGINPVILFAMVQLIPLLFVNKDGFGIKSPTKIDMPLETLKPKVRCLKNGSRERKLVCEIDGLEDLYNPVWFLESHLQDM